MNFSWWEGLYQRGTAVFGLATACVWPPIVYALTRGYTDYSWDLMRWPPVVAWWGRLGLAVSLLRGVMLVLAVLALGRRRALAVAGTGLALVWVLDGAASWQWETGTRLAEPGLTGLIGSFAWTVVSWLTDARLLVGVSSALVVRAAAPSVFRRTRLEGMAGLVMSVGCLGYVLYWLITRANHVFHEFSDATGLLEGLPRAVAFSWVAFPPLAALLSCVGVKRAWRMAACRYAAAAIGLVVIVAAVSWGWLIVHWSMSSSVVFMVYVTLGNLWSILDITDFPPASACALLAGPLAWGGLPSVARQIDR
jgi:hypothetical protein